MDRAHSALLTVLGRALIQDLQEAHELLRDGNKTSYKTRTEYKLAQDSIKRDAVELR